MHCSASKSTVEMHVFHISSILNFMKFNKYLEENADFGLKKAYMNEISKAAFVELKE